jgi:hypothetical protein
MSKNEITRRAIARAITALPIFAATAARASAAAATSATSRNEQAAQPHPAPAQAAASGEVSPLQKAHDKVRQTSDKLRAIDVAMTVEPAFTFRA